MQRATTHVKLGVEQLEDRLTPSVASSVRVETWFDVNRNGRQDTDEMGHGTGTMIGRDAVLTAAHNLYDNDPRQGVSGRFGYATAVWVSPGYNQGNRPFGRIPDAGVAVPASYQRGQEAVSNVDFAVVRLSRPVGDQTGWHSVATPTDAEVRARLHRYSGYPGRPVGDGDTQLSFRGPADGVSGGMIVFQKARGLQSAPGSSGSGLIADNVSLPAIRRMAVFGTGITGVISGSTNNGRVGLAVRMDASRVQWVRDVLAASPVPRAAGQDGFTAVGVPGARIAAAETDIVLLSVDVRTAAPPILNPLEAPAVVGLTSTDRPDEVLVLRRGAIVDPTDIQVPLDNWPADGFCSPRTLNGLSTEGNNARQADPFADTDLEIGGPWVS